MIDIEVQKYLNILINEKNFYKYMWNSFKKRLSTEVDKCSYGYRHVDYIIYCIEGEASQKFKIEKEVINE